MSTLKQRVKELKSCGHSTKDATLKALEELRQPKPKKKKGKKK